MAAIDISKLSLDEKWELLDDIWESIYESPDAAALTTAQRTELYRRSQDLDRDIKNGVTPLGKPFREAVEGIRNRTK